MDFPTPPLPAPTAITFLNGAFSFSFNRASPRTRDPNFREIFSNSGMSRRSAFSQSVRIVSLSGHAGVVSITVKLKSFPLMAIFSIKPRETRSLCNSGSFTVDRASSTLFSLIVSGMMAPIYRNERVRYNSQFSGSIEILYQSKRECRQFIPVQ